MHQGYHKKTYDPWPTECAHLCNHLSKYTNLVYTKTVNKIAGLLRFYSNFKYLLLFTSKQHAQDLHLNVVIITETFCNIIPLFWYLQKQLFTSVSMASDGFLPCCYKIKWIVCRVEYTLPITKEKNIRYKSSNTLFESGNCHL